MTRRINLLPPEIAIRRRSRRQASVAIMAGVGLVVILGLFFVVQAGRLGVQRDRLARKEAENATLQTRVDALKQFDERAREVEAKTKLLDDLTFSEVRWSVVLADISLVIPANTWLTNFSATVSAVAPGTQARPGERLQLGKIDLSGVTFSHVDVAKWLVRLAGVDGFTFPYLSLSAKADIGETPVVEFTTSVQLSEEAFRRNQRGSERPR